MNLLINLDVDDLEKAITFYGAAFGLKTGRRFGDDAVEMLGGPCPIDIRGNRRALICGFAPKQITAGWRRPLNLIARR